MSDSWMNAIEVLVERWRAESEPVRLTPSVDFEVPGEAASEAAVGVAELRPALEELSREGRLALTELAEAIRSSLAALDGSLRAARDSAPGIAPVAALAPSGADASRLGDDLKSLLEKMAEENRVGRAEQVDVIRNALAEFSEEDMVGRAGLAKSLKVGMADLAEKNRRVLEDLNKGLAQRPAGEGDTVTFHPDPVADQAFETVGAVGAFPQLLVEGAARQISVSDCYAAQVNDDSMAPLACEGQTLLVSRSLPAKNGDLVIVQLADGRWVFKRFVLRGDQHQLLSVNAQLGLPTIVLAEPPAQIHVVVGVIFGRALARAPQQTATSSAAVG
jgi:phage repressor protein C with HTH and peptisase S24 domain